mgnify:CR=1 FL=1|jgi:nucleotide-binding universal stress UspA family protein
MDVPETGEERRQCIVVAVDGSRVSRKALDIAISMAGRDKYLVVYHVMNSKKKNMGFYSADYLEIEFNSICYKANMSRRNFEVIVEERVEDYPISQMVLDKVNELDASLLCLGAFGRKGPSVWASGSNANHSLRRCPVSVLTAKPRSDVILEGAPATFLVGHDGSKRAQKAMDLVKEFSKPQDQTIIVNIVDEWLQAKGFDVEKLMREAKEDANAAGVGNVSTYFAMRDRTMTIGQQILALSEEWNASYLVAGLDGMRAVQEGRQVMGSVSDFIVEKSRCTCIIAR